ncbi:STE20-like serine/threonine-protein kinase [Asparagus officinalis]|uniref:STE20-like serine/threonine-protein kinase n=1 Tax=Asparagus officinalis TaxID=4686 RepID=UPI00098DEFC1|nr:STE20-like serine/threonine-protein kinase [Asparagus officinalis]XP_020242385.1 STE20-like serine/threonine-protein kinase [Asparagus officinalis]
MEMEGGRSFSELLRNSSEEMFLKTVMENPIGISAPSMEMLGFRNITQSFRGDSEELFNSWLMNGEIPGYSSANSAQCHRTRQASRLSTELASSQQNGVAFQKRNSNENLFQQSLSRQEEPSNNSTPRSLWNAAEKGMEASNLYLAKAWFHSSQPMTRSRSSELRRRYAAMQNFQTPTIPEVPYIPVQELNGVNQGFNHTINFNDVSGAETANQLQSFMSPSNSSTSAFNTHPVANVDNVSSVVNMLKCALEQKKLGNQENKETLEGSSFSFYNSQEIPVNISADQNGVNQTLEPPRTFHGVNQIQPGAMSQEPSQSESSAVAPALSTGCDNAINSGQTFSVCESTRKNISNGNSAHASKAKEYRERILENNLKDDRKKRNIVRMGSVSSCGSVDKGDPTKKRRVERSRKMQEAKERSSTPTLPSDMQSVLKRCETLEKEVRSLKLNLSFMNRKDSEQTKQIEELQKQTEDLSDEKERLLEEIERIISETGNM